QANDGLHEICMAIGLKSFLFCNRIRNANSQQTKTWARREVAVASSTIQHHCHVYTQARKAMVDLGADEGLLNKYKILHAEDVKAITHIMDSSIWGMRDEMLSWIWAADVAGDGDQLTWMEELHHVNWLKTKAQKDRWQEELEIVLAEMQWVVRYFERKAYNWEGLTERSSELGGKAYCLRQHAMWSNLAHSAPGQFLHCT
ncbi:hypothetical protein WOLCODRAFT_67047, partial [Wolfiporia cocos MD-104 SS10]